MEEKSEGMLDTQGHGNEPRKWLKKKKHKVDCEKLEAGQKKYLMDLPQAVAALLPPRGNNRLQVSRLYGEQKSTTGMRYRKSLLLLSGNYGG